MNTCFGDGARSAQGFNRSVRTVARLIRRAANLAMDDQLRSVHSEFIIRQQEAQLHRHEQSMRQREQERLDNALFETLG